MCKLCVALKGPETMEGCMTMAILIGDYYGYPRCCSFSFIHGATGVIPTMNLQWQMSVGSFVPCPYHAIELNNNYIKIEDLISKDRKCPYPFPRGGYSKPVLRYIEQQMKDLDFRQFVIDAHTTNPHSVANQILPILHSIK